MADSSFYSPGEFHHRVQRCAAEAGPTRGDVEWTVIGVGLVTLTVFAGSLVMTLTGAVHFLPAAIINVLAIYSCQIVTHEASHNNVFSERRFGAWPNTAIGYLFAIPLMWDFRTFQVIHLAHHKHCNDRVDDPQYRGNVVESWRNLYRFAARMLSFGTAKAETAEAGSGADRRDGRTFSFTQPRSWYLFHGCLVLFFVLAPKVLLLVWVIPAFIATSLVVWMHTSLHTQAHGDEPGIVKSKLIVSKGILGGLLNAVFLYQNYHLIHHMMPKVPFHKTARISRRVLADYPAKGIVHIDYSEAARTRAAAAKT